MGQEPLIFLVLCILIYVVPYKYQHILITLLITFIGDYTQDTQQCIFYVMSLRLLPNSNNSNK